MGTGTGVFDALLMFLSTGNLTKTGLHPTSGLKLRGTPIGGLAARISIPSTPGFTYTQLLIEHHVSKDDSTYRLQSTYPGGAQSWASGAKEFMLPIESISEYPYNKLKFTISNSSSTVSFGAVQAGVVPRAHGDWTRVPTWG